MKNSIANASLKLIIQENKALRSEIVTSLKKHAKDKEALYSWLFGQLLGTSFISHLQEAIVCIALRHAKCTKTVKHSYELKTEEECKRAIKVINDPKLIAFIGIEFDIAIKMSVNGKNVVFEYSESK